MKVRAWIAVATILATAGEHSVVATCCQALSRTKSLERKVFYPGSAVYEERLDSIWSLSARQAPWCVVLPASTDDASDVMKVISKHECPFGIRGGGHGMHALSNTVEHGVTIDFGYMNATTYHQDRGIVAFGPGSRSVQIYEDLEPDGVWVTAGRVAPVGASGFVLGGGISYLWANHGWGCDNLVNFEMVLANGTIVNANETHNRQLWIAQRGGSGNFGLVTRFDMQAVPYANPRIPKIWGGVITYDYRQTEKYFIDAFIRFGRGHATDTNSAVVFLFGFDSSEKSWSMASIMSNAANIPNAPILKPIATLPHQLNNTLRTDTMANFAIENTGVGNVYNIWFTSTFDNDARILGYIQRHHPDLVARLSNALPKRSNFTTLTTYHAITPTIVSHAHGNNVLGLERHVAGNKVGVLWLIWVELNTAEEQAIAIPVVQAWQDEVNAYATHLGINWDWEYLNYAHGLQDPISKYGEENIKKLKLASRNYDPTGIFQKLRGSGFKIPQ